MLYEKYLEKLKVCPFCSIKKNEVLKQNKNAILILAKAPYTKDHLLVVSRKHALKLKDLTKQQKEDIEKLINYGMKLLNKKYNNVTILYREGNKKQAGKSIDHMHYHLIPKMKIGSININWKKRKIYSDKDYAKKIKEFKDGK